MLIILICVAGAIILILAIALGISTDEAIRANKFDPAWLKETLQPILSEELDRRQNYPGVHGKASSRYPEHNAANPDTEYQTDVQPEDGLTERAGFENEAMDLDATQRARAALTREKAEFESWRDREKARLLKAEADMKQRLNRYY